MPGFARFAPALLLLVACGSESPQAQSDVGRAHAETTRADESKPSACRLDEVHTLAAVLSDADSRERRTLVAERLPKACDLPEGISTYLAATEVGASDDARRRATVSAASLLEHICPEPETLSASLGPMDPATRARTVFDACGLGRLGLVQRDRWLDSGAGSVAPFAAAEWLQGQGADAVDSRQVANALLLREHKIWSRPGQLVYLIPGPLPPVPRGAIALSISPAAIHLEGAHVLPLDEGRLALRAGAPPKTLRDAILAELEAVGEGDVTFAVVADARVPSETIVQVASLADEVGAEQVGLVAQSEPFGFGFVALDFTERPVYEAPTLEMRKTGFALSPPGGGTPQLLKSPVDDVVYDFDALATKARAFVEESDEPTGVNVRVGDGVPTSVLIAALNKLRGARCATDSQRCLFRTVRLVRGSDPVEVARSAGILGVLSGSGGVATIGAYGTLGDTEGVFGGLSEDELDEAFGVGGLGLSGIGRGGGGTGEGTIGLGELGTIGGPSAGGGATGRGRRVPRVRQSKASVKGPLDKDIIRRIVRAHINEVRHCYNQGLTKDPDLAGRVTIEFTIGSDGKVSKSEVDTTTLDDESVGTCVAKAVKRWKFPKPLGGGVVVVKYPFVLAPG